MRNALWCALTLLGASLCQGAEVYPSKSVRAEVRKALEVPEVKERFIAQGAELVGSSPEEFSMLIRGELRRWAEVIKSAGITPE